MTSTTHAHWPLRNRAIQLIEEFFAVSDGDAVRRTIFNHAFDSYRPSPVSQIDFSGPLAKFAAEAADRLLSFGGVGRGKHALSRLIETMASERGRQSNPDFHDLPRLLDAQCNVPTRAEELAYLQRLIDEIEAKARLYSPLSGIGKPTSRVDARLDPRADNNALALLVRHHSRKRQPEIELPAREYDDILTAFSEVRQAALLGAPGSGKSTTLRRLALDLARRALDHVAEPLPLLVSLANWIGDEPLPHFLAENCPEVGWAVEGLQRNGRLTLLLDGLNEVPTAKRGSKAAQINKFCKESRRLNAKTSVVVSSRREDYVGDVDLGIDTLTLEPLTPQRIHEALRNWIVEQGGQPEAASRLWLATSGSAPY